MNKKFFLVMPAVILLVVVSLLIGGLNISIAAVADTQSEYPRLVDPNLANRPAPVRSLPQWGGAWQYGPDTGFQFTRFDGEFYPNDGKVYFMGGRLANGDTDGSVWSFDPVALVYTDMDIDLITPISNYTMNLLQDASGDWGFYVFCGRSVDGTMVPYVQVYYPETNTVAQLDPADNFPGSLSCTSAVNVVYQNKVYLAGGFDGTVNSAETWVFDPAGAPGSKWAHIPTANLGVARAYIMGGLVDDLIYAIGGSYLEGGALINVEIVEVLDPNAAEPEWDDISVADLPEGCSEGRAYSFDTGSPYNDPDGTPLGGKIISSCGGWPDENEHVYVYDTHLDTWDEFPYLQTDRRSHAAAFIPTNQPFGTGTPGLWVWGGRKDSDANVLVSSEYYQVNYTGFDCHVLIVADDWKFGSQWGGIPYYTSALDYLEFEYDLWETDAQGDPVFADLIPYDAVVWFTGYAWQDVITPQNEEEVSAYLDAGGNLLLSAQDYYYDSGLTAFMQDYLGVASLVNDVIELDPVGIESNPIGHGLGPYAMARPDDWEVYWPEDQYEGPYNDYAFAHPGAAEPFRFDASGQSNSTNYDSGTFRTVFLAWAFEWIDTVEERAEIMEAALGWMCSAGLGNLNLIPPMQSDGGIPGESVPYTLTLVNNLGYTETFTITYESDWPLEGPDTIGPISNGSSEAFEVLVMVPEGTNCYQSEGGAVTAIAQSDPELTATAYLMTSSLPDGAGSLDGLVYDANTGLGIPSAYVFVGLDRYYYQTWTDEQGEYLFTDLPACAYDAGFNAIGYYNQFNIPFSIADGLITTLDAHLTAAMPELSTDSISIHVPENSLGEYRLLISNTGTGDLHFHISDIPPESGLPTAIERPGLPKGIDEELLTALSAYPGATSKFIVYFKEQADLTPAFNIQDRYLRGQYVLDTLRVVASSSQAGLASELDRLGIEYEPRYIVNAMQVTGDLHLVNQIAALPEVAFIGANIRVSAPEPVEMSPASGGISALAWNIAQVRADEVWDEFGVTGTGIVVSNIDTGVQYDHPALVNQYRGNLGVGVFDHNYNWWDPYGDQPMAPYDYHAHGSHTIGTMVGDDGTEHIGMAPDGQWIACNGFKQGGYGYTAELLECAEFILAPWDLTGANPNPDLRPDIVNNSWGGGQADWWYNQAIYAWRAAGIFPVFSNGNAGPACSTTGAPDYENVMAVGATNNMDVIAGFSSRGPALITEITKPDVAAPGVSVYSAYNNSGYGLMSGTSMAAPHVAGQAALIWAAVPELRGHVQLTYWIIEQTAMPILDGQCGDPNPPNNVYGWGRIDAYQAVSLALSRVWQTAWLTVDPLMGVVSPDESAEILLSFDTHELEDGLCYDTTLRVEFNDPYIIETFLPVELCVSDVADLKVTKTADPSPVFIGEPLTYIIKIYNKGPSPAVDVSIIDTLPAEVTFISASPGCIHSNGIVTCDLDQLAAGAFTTIEIMVTAPDDIGKITNVVTVASSVYDNDLNNNTAKVSTKVKEPPIRKVYLPLVISH